MAAPQAAGQAVEMGYQNVFLFRDGLPSWALVGYPIKSIEVLPAHEIPTISTDDLKKRLAGDEDFSLLDIRTIDGKNYWIDDPRRLHIPLDEIPVRFNEIPEGKKLTLIDMLGRRTAIAARLLHSRGVQEMDKVGGGMNQWVINGFPVARNE
jgi:rhodanese-related sulfurtransferase